jgi:hypothetical protein
VTVEIREPQVRSASLDSYSAFWALPRMSLLHRRYSYKGCLIQVQVVEREGRFLFSYRIDGNTEIGTQGLGARNSASAVASAMVAAKNAVDTR